MIFVLTALWFCETLVELELNFLNKVWNITIIWASHKYFPVVCESFDRGFLSARSRVTEFQCNLHLDGTFTFHVSVSRDLYSSHKSRTSHHHSAITRLSLVLSWNIGTERKQHPKNKICSIQRLLTPIDKLQCVCAGLRDKCQIWHHFMSRNKTNPLCLASSIIMFIVRKLSHNSFRKVLK